MAPAVGQPYNQLSAFTEFFPPPLTDSTSTDFVPVPKFGLTYHCFINCRLSFFFSPLLFFFVSSQVRVAILNCCGSSLSPHRVRKAVTNLDVDASFYACPQGGPTYCSRPFRILLSSLQLLPDSLASQVLEIVTTLDIDALLPVPDRRPFTISVDLAVMCLLSPRSFMKRR